MARRAPRGDEPLSATLTVRLPASVRARIDQQAAAANLTPSAFGAEVLRSGRVVIEQRQTLAAPLMAELSRIGNNINQLAYETNAGTPPAVRDLVAGVQELLQFMMQDELLRRRVEAFEATKGAADDSSTSRTRDQFQRRVGVPVPR